MLAIHLPHSRQTVKLKATENKLLEFASYLSNHISDARLLYAYVPEEWREMAFPRIVEHLIRTTNFTALERLSLQQEHAREYGDDGSTNSYWHLAKLMTAFEIQNVVGDMLKTTLVVAQQVQTADENLPLSDQCTSCLQNAYKTSGCWFTKDGVTIQQYVVMPRAVAEEIWSALSRNQITQEQLRNRLLQDDVLQTGTPFLNKQKCALLDQQIRNLWREKIAPRLAEQIVRTMQFMDLSIAEGQKPKFNVDRNANQDEMQLHELLLQYNAPHYARCKSTPPTLQHFVLHELMHIDVMLKYFTQQTRGFVETSRGQRVFMLQTLDRPSLEKLARDWQNFNVDSILDYVSNWQRLNMTIQELQQLEKIDTSTFQTFETPHQILLEINRSIRSNESLSNLISRLQSRELIPLIVELQDRLEYRNAMLSTTTLRTKLLQDDIDFMQVVNVAKQFAKENSLDMLEIDQLERRATQERAKYLPIKKLYDANKNAFAKQDLDQAVQVFAQLKRELDTAFVNLKSRAKGNQDENQGWLQKELAIPGLVDDMRAFLSSKSNDRDALNTLYQARLRGLLEANKADQQVLLLTFLMNLWKNDAFVQEAVWQDAVWSNMYRRKQYEQAVVKFIRYLLTRDADVYEQAWKHVEAAQLKIAPIQGYRRQSRSPENGKDVSTEKQMPNNNTSITEAANFRWASAGGGSCAFDALFSGLFKMPNTWLQQQIFQATNVRPFNNQICASDQFHDAVIDDILFLQGQLQGEQRRACLTRTQYYACLGEQEQTDDPQYLLSQLLAFYNLQDSVFAYSYGEYRLSTTKRNEQTLANQLDSVDRYQMLLFEVENPIRPLQNRSIVTFDIPEQIAIYGTSDSFVLLTCFVTTGGHWLSYVRDYSNGNWWKFDAIRDPPYERLGQNVPNAVLGRDEWQKPAAYLYVRMATKRPRQQSDEEKLQELEKRPIAHKQQARQSLFELRALRSKVDEARLRLAIAEKESLINQLPNWWQYEGESTSTTNRIRTDPTYLPSLGLQFISSGFVFEIPQFILEQYPTEALLWLVENVLRLPNQGGKDRLELQRLLVDRIQSLKGLIPALFETVEHRPEVSVKHDLLDPLHNQIEQHWPLISQNSVWLPVFQKMRLDQHCYDFTIDELHNLADISRLLNHMDANEPVPKELFQDVLKKLQ